MSGRPFSSVVKDFQQVMGLAMLRCGFESRREGTVMYGYLSEPELNHKRGAKTPRPKETQGGVWRSVQKPRERASLEGVCWNIYVQARHFGCPDYLLAQWLRFSIILKVTLRNSLLFVRTL